MTQTRRLAAILAADVAGYSRLIGADEGGTLQALKAIRAELIDPTIATHNGRLVKTMGDGLLVEFGSVVDALRCATEVQAGMAARNTAVSNDRRIQFRIGINVGDIVVEDGDIFGDGVNVAAKLEGLAEAGGICVSARVQGAERNEVRQEPMVRGLSAGGRWIRTCMGLFLSSGSFRFVTGSLFGAKSRSSSRRLRPGSRSARKGSRDRNASVAWRLAA
jgi:class 3 adenylate cyclase